MIHHFAIKNVALVNHFFLNEASALLALHFCFTQKDPQVHERCSLQLILSSIIISVKHPSLMCSCCERMLFQSWNDRSVSFGFLLI